MWHLTRVQDDHVADVAGRRAGVDRRQDFVSRFDLPLDADDTGFGHIRDQVGRGPHRRRPARGYLTAVHEQTVEFLATVGEDDLDRVVDDRWDPPVTLGVRLVSVLDDDLATWARPRTCGGCWGCAELSATPAHPHQGLGT